MNQSSISEIDLEKTYKTCVPHAAALAEAHIAVQKINATKIVYDQIVKALGGKMPWYFPALLHYREDSSLSQRVYLGNGERIIGSGELTKLVPKHRGPFANFQQGAVDAFKVVGLDRVTDFSLGGTLFAASRWNGLWYLAHHVVSPYLFAGTTAYHSGKFVADGKFDPNAVDKQIGIAVLMKAMKI